MQKLNKILMVSQSFVDEADVLKQALSLARNNNASLDVLVTHPFFPQEMSEHVSQYEAVIKNNVDTSLQSVRNELGIAESEISISIRIETTNHLAVTILKQAALNNYDLVIKDAEVRPDGKGFTKLDMELLRKCASPLWLSRPIKRHRQDIRVAVAIDPETVTPEGRDLSLSLLRSARGLADTCDGNLRILSCWEYEFEEYLRRNMWIKVSPDFIEKTTQRAQSQHRAALDAIIKESGVGGQLDIQHVRGGPDSVIPTYANDHQIDILVMGTVARTGIEGFLIGNTAEAIVQRLGCSLLAMKPQGFASSIK